MLIWMPILSSLLILAGCAIMARSLGDAWDGVTQRYIADLRPALAALSLDQSKLPMYLRLWGLTMVVVCSAIAFWMGMFPLALGVGYLLYIAPRFILQFLIERRKMLLRDQMVSATVALANSCRAGLSLAQGLETVAKEAPQPLSIEIKRIVTDYEHGKPLPEAIRDARDRLELDSFTLFSTAVLVAMERGGRVTNALERISESMQETQRLERKLSADTASGKSVVLLLTVFPFFFLGLMFLMQYENTMMVFGTIIGQFIMLLVMAMVYFGARWCQSILNIEM